MDTRDTNSMSQNASLCRSGCGFYGNPASDGLCSKCYKDALKRKQQAPASQTTSTSSSVVGHSAVSPVSGHTTGRSSPLLNTFVAESSSTSLPLLAAAAIDSSLNTALPTVPSAIISAQESCSQLKQENSANQDVANKNDKISTPQTSSPSENQQQSDLPKTQKKKKPKCTKCKVNVGVLGFPCRCGGLFCSQHRYANEHNCSFDYREHGAEEIRRNNPQVIGEKIQKI